MDQLQKLEGPRPHVRAVNKTAFNRIQINDIGLGTYPQIARCDALTTHAL